MLRCNEGSYAPPPLRPGVVPDPSRNQPQIQWAETPADDAARAGLARRGGIAGSRRGRSAVGLANRLGIKGQRRGAATPPRNSWTTTPRRRGGGASHSGWARLVATSFSPARQRPSTVGVEKSAILPERPSALPS